ncbi:MAG: hypothetical protein AVDCRST_MAG26-2627, partial [uncultured Chloroflexia bacterium]
MQAHDPAIRSLLAPPGILASYWDALTAARNGQEEDMEPSCLQYRLTDEERHTFNETGLLVVEDALSPQRVAELTTITDRIFASRLAAGHDARTALFYPNFIPDSSRLADLVDYERVLPKVWGILGWNIYLYHAHLIVTPPAGTPQDDRTFGWHQDSGRVN